MARSLSKEPVGSLRKKNINNRVLLYILYRSGAAKSEIADRAPEIDIDYLLEDLPQMIDSMPGRVRSQQEQHQQSLCVPSPEATKTSINTDILCRQNTLQLLE